MNHEISLNLNKKDLSSLLLLVFLAQLIMIPTDQTGISDDLPVNVYESAPLSQKKPLDLTDLLGFSNEYGGDLGGLDKNHNKMSDHLDLYLSTISNGDQVPVIVVSENADVVPTELIDRFKELGGEVNQNWRSLGMFRGAIPANLVQSYTEQSAREGLLLVELDREVVTLSNQAVRNTQVNSRVWGNYSMLGDENTSVAIFDTGFDDSHSIIGPYSDHDFASSHMVGWYDATGDNALSPEDYDGHGTHVAGIAVGRPYNGTTPGMTPTTWSQTFTSSTTYTDPVYYSFTLDVTTDGVLSQTFHWRKTGTGLGDTYGTEIRLYGPSMTLVDQDTTGTGGNDFHIEHTIDPGEEGLYTVYVIFVYGNTDHVLDMVSYGNYPTDPDLLTVNATYSGVAPNSKLVGVKVFNNEGSGLTSYIVDGIDWVITNKDLYHITVASLSLNVPCSSSGCVEDDRSLSLERAVTRMVEEGIVVFVSAGNDGQEGKNMIGSPSNLDKVITVGSTDDNHEVAYYSSEGPGIGSNTTKPDLTAPGGVTSQGAILQADTNDNDVEGTGNGILSDLQANDLTALQGTSMAAPHAAGVGLLLVDALGGYHNWNYTTGEVNRVKSAMMMATWASYGADRGEKDQVEGWGEVQADGAVDLLIGQIFSPNTTIAGSVGTGLLETKLSGYRFTLESGKTYSSNLSLSSGLDADLYLYHPNPNQSNGEPILIQVAKADGKGLSDYLTITPEVTGNYFLVVKAFNGTGNFTLEVTSYETTPTTLVVESPTEGNVITGMTTIKVSASDTEAISQVYARFADSGLFRAMIYNSSSHFYELEVNTTFFEPTIYSSVTVMAVDSTGVQEYRNRYFSLGGKASSPTLGLVLTSLNSNEVNTVEENVVFVEWDASQLLDEVHIYQNHLYVGSFTNQSVNITLTEPVTELRLLGLSGILVDRTYAILEHGGPQAPISSRPSDLVMEEHTSGNKITWLPVDANPAYYLIYENGSLMVNTTWQSGVTIDYSTDHLARGSYNLTIILVDYDNLSFVDMVFVAVVLQKPSITSPADISYAKGSTGNKITWLGYDDNPATFTIFVNGTQNQTGVWTNGTNITLEIDGHSVGYYNYTIILVDQDGQDVADSIIVWVKAEPLISSPPDLEIIEGMAGHMVEWVVTDDNPAEYMIKLNNLVVRTGTINSTTETITFPLEDLVTGNYELILLVVDLTDLSSTDIVLITVVANQVPQLTHPDDVSFTEGTEGQSISWEVTDDNPDTYQVFKSGSITQEGNFSNSTIVTVSLDGLTPGLWNYTFVVLDKSGVSSFDTVFVAVDESEKDPPIITSVNDLSYVIGTPNQELAWVATSENPADYEISLNDEVVVQGIWISGETIRYTLDHLTEGTHVVTITVFDTFGKEALDTVIVEVFPMVPLIVGPEDMSILEGLTNISLEWYFYDDNPSLLEVYQDGSMIKSSSWTNGSKLTIDLTGLVVGTHNFTIFAFDLDSHLTIDTVIVRVLGEGSTDSLSESTSNTDPSVSSTVNSGYGLEILLGLILLSSLLLWKRRK